MIHNKPLINAPISAGLFLTLVLGTILYIINKIIIMNIVIRDLIDFDRMDKSGKTLSRNNKILRVTTIAMGPIVVRAQQKANLSHSGLVSVFPHRELIALSAPKNNGIDANKKINVPIVPSVPTLILST